MKKYKIIIVENDEDEQFFMKESFDEVGLFDILDQVKNGDALLELMEKPGATLPDIILSDLNMPGKNGYDIIVELKEHPVFNKIPVVITSTSSTKSIADKCLNLGAADYLVKPDTFIEYTPYVKQFYQRIQDRKLVK